MPSLRVSTNGTEVHEEVGPSDRVSTVSVSVVTYGSDVGHLSRAIATLASATTELGRGVRPGVRLILVDNGPADDGRLAVLANALSVWGGDSEIIAGHGNVGYGRGHNLAIQSSDSTFHLILNPDVEIAADALQRGIAFFRDNPDCGVIAAAVRGETGELQYLCKRYPTVLDLVLRGFAPRFVRNLFRGRLNRYEMRDVINDRDLVWDPAIISGCFMFFRSHLLKDLGGFDPRYFLYFEDFDLSLRAAQRARIAYVPSLKVLHHGGGAASKGYSHIGMFAASAFKFFSAHGWKFL